MRYYIRDTYWNSHFACDSSLRRSFYSAIAFNWLTFANFSSFREFVKRNEISRKRKMAFSATAKLVAAICTGMLDSWSSVLKNDSIKDLFWTVNNLMLALEGLTNWSESSKKYCVILKAVVSMSSLLLFLCYITSLATRDVLSIFDLPHVSVKQWTKMPKRREHRTMQS